MKNGKPEGLAKKTNQRPIWIGIIGMWELGYNPENHMGIIMGYNLPDFYILTHSKTRWDWVYFEPRICRIFSNIVMLVVLLNFWETLKMKCSLMLCSGTKQKQKCQIRSRHGIISWNDLDEDSIPFSRKVHKSIHQSGCFANATFHWFFQRGRAVG